MPLPTTNSAPLERQLLRDVVYERIYTGIIDGTLEPGETLLDEKLTSWLGVSRTPVREALMRLADIGLVEMSPNRYTRVAPLDLRAIDEGVYTSGILLEYAVRQVVPTIANTTLSSLDRHVKDAKKHAKSKDLPALAMSVNQFFLEFERVADNTVLLAVSEGLSPQLLRYVTVWQLPFEVESLPAAIEAIAAAAKARDTEKATELVRDLYAPTRSQFLDEYRRTDEEIDANPII